MRVMIIADDPRTVPALKFLLRYQPGITAVEHTAFWDGLAQQVERARPDVLLIDSDSSRALVDAALALCRHLPHTFEVIVLSSTYGPERSALDLGVDALVAKSEPPGQLLAILQEVQLRPNLSGQSEEA